MQAPISTRCRSLSCRARLTGEPGWSNSVVIAPAEIMNMPSAQPSMRYSGQCACSVRTGDMSASRLEAGVQRHAAVDEEADAMHVVRIVGCEPDRSSTDLVGLADALVGDQLEQLRVGLRRAPRFHVDRRANRAGADAVHAN